MRWKTSNINIGKGIKDINMTTLTKLEMKQLHQLASDLQVIVDSYKMKSDSLADFIFDQGFKTNDPDLLKDVVDHLKLVGGKIEDMQASMDLIMDHFKSK